MRTYVGGHEVISDGLSQSPIDPQAATYALYFAGALLAAYLLVRGVGRLRSRMRVGTPAVLVAGIAAVACTAYSADTSWRFAADYLDMGSTAERAVMFGAAELALFATALMARQKLNGPDGSPGAPGVLVWVITGVQVIPAYAESGLVGGTVRAFVGPVMAAMLWHLAMGIELKHRKPEAETNGLAAVLGREVRERLLSRLGIATRNRDAAQITRDRATARAVALAAELADMAPKKRAKRSGRRIARRLSAAVGRASVGGDQTQRQQLLDQLSARRHATALATIELPSPWEPAPDTSADLAADARRQMREATTSIRSWGYPGLVPREIGPVQRADSDERSPEQDEPAKLSTEEAQAAILAGWREGLTVRQTAERATRAPSYVHSVFVKLDQGDGQHRAAAQSLNGRKHEPAEPEAH